MPLEIRNVDSFQTRFFMSFKNMTKTNPSTFPAVTSIQIKDYPGTNQEPLTSINIFDQWALRTTT